MKMTPFYRVSRFVMRLFFQSMGGLDVVGTDKIPTDGHGIIACNHLSYMDPPLIAAAVRRSCCFMARSTLFRNPLFALLIRNLGAFPVNRDNPTRSLVRHVLALLEAGNVVVMFPEGTRSEDGRLQHGESGIAAFVHWSGAPVIPAAVIGSNKMLSRSQRWPHRAHTRVIFGDPIFFTPDSPRSEIVTGTMRAIAALLTANGVPSVAFEDQAVQTDREVGEAPDA